MSKKGCSLPDVTSVEWILACLCIATLFAVSSGIRVRDS